MTADEVRRRATKIAQSLNWPWDAAALDVRSWRIWPFPHVWLVKSRVVRDRAIATMRINDRTQKMVSGRVRYGI
jgi:hypothetical protein